MLFSVKKKTVRNLKCILLSERSQSEKRYILHDSNYSRKNHVCNKKLSVYWGVSEWMNRQSTEDF